MQDNTTTIEALRERVHPPERTCAACGTRAPAVRPEIRRDQLTGGPDHVWGLCAQCESAHHVGALDAAVLREVLGLDVGDPVLGRVHVPWFADGARRHPDKPQATRWRHVDRDALAGEVARWRAAREARKGGPCRYCGTTLTPAGTRWHTTSGIHSKRATCGRCSARLQRIGHESPYDMRDLAAAVLIGLERSKVVKVPREIGAQVGLLWWEETPGDITGEHPFAHVDVPALRARALELAQAGAFRLPRGWTPDQQVVW